MSLLHFMGDQGLSFSPGMVMLEPQVGEAATFALGAYWPPVLFLQPTCHTHVPSNSLLLRNALSEECSTTQMVGEQTTPFLVYILNIFDCFTFEPLPCHFSHFFTIAMSPQDTVSKKKRGVLRQGMGLINPAKEVTLRNARQSRHGQCCTREVGSTKWQWVSITFL